MSVRRRKNTRRGTGRDRKLAKEKEEVDERIIPAKTRLKMNRRKGIGDK